MTQRSLLTLLLSFATASCTATTIEPGPHAGSLSLALAGTDPHGISYRLRSAQFEVSGCGDYNPSFAAGAAGGGGAAGQSASNCVDIVLNSDDQPDAELLTQRLLPGYYNVRLLDGWTLERLTAAGPTTIDKALLLSSSDQSAYVWDGGETQVVFSFGVGGDLIDFRHGDLTIGISVEQPGDHNNSCGESGAGGSVTQCPSPAGSGFAGFSGVAGAGGSFAAGSGGSN